MEEKRRRELEEAEEERMLELNRRISADLPLTKAETASLHARGRGRRGGRKNFLEALSLLVPVMYVAFHFVTFLATMVFVRTRCSHREICFFLRALVLAVSCSVSVCRLRNTGEICVEPLVTGSLCSVLVVA